MNKAMSSSSGPAGGFLMPVKDAPNDGVMVALRLPLDVADMLLALLRAAGVPKVYLVDAAEMHITLAYLGNAADQTGPDEEALQAGLETFAAGWSSLSGSINGIGRFMDNPDQDVLYANFDSPALLHFRQALVVCLKGLDCQVVETHGFTPHITLAYVPKDMRTPTIGLDPIDVSFVSLWEAYGDRGDYDIPLGATKGGSTLPFKIKHRGSEFVVVNADTNKVVGHHPTKDSADAHVCALDAAKSEPHTHRPPSNYNADTYAAAQSTEIYEEAAPAQAANLPAEKDSTVYAYPEGGKLPMPDGQHVVLAAAALGPNPPHGHGADIPSDDLGKVKARIRSRAHELGLSKEDLAKVNSYLSGRMPEAKMSTAETNAWSDIFQQALEQTGSEVMAACAAQGVLNRRAVLGLKAVSGGLPTTVEGWGVLFTDPQELDLQGTYFDAMTRLLTEYYPNAPLWMEHGADPDYGADPIGFRTRCQVFPIGVWLEHDLHLTHPLYARTAKDVADGKFSYSSDSLAHYAAQGYDPADGRLGEWPLAGCSLTKTPAEPGLGPVKAKTLELALKSAVQQREAAGGLEVKEDLGQLVEVAATKKESLMDEDDKIEEEVEVELQEEVVAVKSVDEYEPLESLLEDEAEDVVEAAKSALDGVNDDNDNFDTSQTDVDSIPMDTLHALSQMYGCDNTPDAIRTHLDQHIAEMHKSGTVHPDLTKAMGLPDGTGPKAVEDHLNGLYSAAMNSAKEVAPPPAAPSPEMSLNYGALHRHLHSGGPAARSKGPYMTGEIASKGINPQSGVTKFPMLGVVADMQRIRRGERPKYVIGSKAMTSASGPTGGYILHQEIAPTVLDPLRAKAVCFQLGATEINMQGTNVLTIPIMNTAPDAGWAGENQATSDTQPAYRTVTLYPHGIYDLVKIPFNVEANMTPQAESQLRTQMAKSIALKIDKAALVGTGGALAANGGMEITGILNTPATQTYAMGTNGRTPSFIDVGQAFGLLDDANVPNDGDSRRGIAMHSQISRAFTLATDALGNPLLRPSWRDAAEREIAAMPYALSNQIPTTVTTGTATNSSYIFGGDWPYMYIGLSDQVEIRLDQTYAGNLQAGLLIYMYVDVKIVYPQAFFTMTGVLPVSISGVTTSTVALS